MLARDLLDQAEHLASLDKKKPKQANLRRAVSSADYSLFHLLAGTVARQLVGSDSVAGLTELFVRTFEHSEMKSVCQKFGNPQLSPRLKKLIHVVSADLAFVANAFVTLQEARHEADYDLSRRFSRGEVLGLIARAEEAFEKWSALPWTSEARIFGLALASGKKLLRE